MAVPTTGVPLASSEAQQSSSVFVGDQLIREQLEEFKDIFCHFTESRPEQRDAHGALVDEPKLTMQELGTMLTALGNNPTEADLSNMCQDVEVDHDGFIDFTSFLSIMAQKIKNSDTEEELIEAFKVFDRDGDGFITASELKFSLWNLGEKLLDSEVDEMVHEGDVDGDGKINFDEFWRMMMAE